jgi:hypothetical protein
VLVVLSGEQEPEGCGTHAFDLQMKPVAQSVSAAHDARQALPAALHPYGLHEVDLPSVHEPMPLQVPGEVNVAFWHVATAQIVSAPGCPAHVA